MSDENPLAASHRLLWEGLPEPRKGPKPTLTLDQIITAAVGIADAEGIDALSMRRLAAELQMSPMSLYRYLPSKTELLNVMLDAVTAPPPRPGDVLGTTWRKVLETSAWEGRALYLQHPWLLQINWARPVLGPNSFAEMERTMSGLKETPFSHQEQIVVMTNVNSYVTGAVRHELLYERAAEESGISDEEYWALQLPVVERALESGVYPVMASMSDDAFDADWEQTFEFGLRHLLDGFEREIERRLAAEGAEATD